MNEEEKLPYVTGENTLDHIRAVNILSIHPSIEETSRGIQLGGTRRWCGCCPVRYPVV